MDNIIELQNTLLLSDSFSSPEKEQGWMNTLTALIDIGNEGLKVFLKPEILEFRDEPSFMETILLFSRLYEGADRDNYGAYFYYVLYKIYTSGSKLVKPNSIKAKECFEKLSTLDDVDFKYTYCMEGLVKSNDNKILADMTDALIEMYFSRKKIFNAEELKTIANTIYKIKGSVLITKYMPFLNSIFYSYAAVNRLDEIVSVAAVYGLLGAETNDPVACEAYNFALSKNESRVVQYQNKLMGLDSSDKNHAAGVFTTDDITDAKRAVAAKSHTGLSIFLSIMGFLLIGIASNLPNFFVLLVAAVFVVFAFINAYSPAKKLDMTNTLIAQEYRKNVTKLRVPMIVCFNVGAIHGSFIRIIIAAYAESSRQYDGMLLFLVGLFIGFFAETIVIVFACLLGKFADNAARNQRIKQEMSSNVNKEL